MPGGIRCEILFIGMLIPPYIINLLCTEQRFREIGRPLAEEVEFSLRSTVQLKSPHISKLPYLTEDTSSSKEYFINVTISDAVFELKCNRFLMANKTPFFFSDAFAKKMCGYSLWLQRG